jgi:AraC-like DNA-binding protein
MDIVFQRGNVFTEYREGQPRRQPNGLLVGQMRTWIEIEPTGRVETFGIRFRPGGAWPFLKFPLDQITDRILDVNDVLPSFSRRMASADDPLREAERWLLEHLPGIPPLDPARLSLHLSPRQLQRLFAERIGISPKRLSRILRFQRALSAFERGRGVHVALDCGYYDQAHLVHDFREFTGCAPTRWDGVAFLQDIEGESRLR